IVLCVVAGDYFFMGTIIILNNTIALNNDKYRFILLFSEKTYLLRITIAGMNKEPVSGFTCRGPMLSVMKCYRRTLFLQGEQRMPPVFLTLPVDDRGRLQHVSQGAVSSLHDEVRNNPGGVTVRLGSSEYRITYAQELPDFFSVAATQNNTGNQGEQPVWLRDALQSTNARTLERQLNNGRTATEVMEEQLDRLLPSRVSASVQGILGKIDACLFVTEQADFQVPCVHLTCPITLSIPERGVFARTSLQSDVCCLYDSTALKEQVSRRLPHPISREAITGAHIIPKEQCHFDLGKGAFIFDGTSL
ncbi:DUF1076 domain-containing protein, partial [Salmonella enterica subsp. salamae]|nr:DUF1076 domain-containing protein [Salmonella enterica subsp. salamae]